MLFLNNAHGTGVKGGGGRREGVGIRHSGADPGFWERGGSDKYIHNWGRVREGACPLP